MGRAPGLIPRRAEDAGPADSLPAYILAGGASRRMGQDKALVQVDGEALALRVARALRAAGFDPITLVGRRATTTPCGGSRQRSATAQRPSP